LTGTTPRSPCPLTEEEQKFVHENFKSMRIKDIANALARTRASISGYCATQGLRNYRRVRYTEREMTFLKNNYQKTATRVLARRLRRSMSSITAIAGQHGWTGSQLKRKIGYAYAGALRKKTNAEKNGTYAGT
jgi:hypothetical protein